MVARRSAGLLVFRRGERGFEVLLAHPGGPLWARRDVGAWSLPKGEYPPDEVAVDAARREFEEELGLPAPLGGLLPLGDVRQAGGKVVTAWAVQGDLDPQAMVPGFFELEWPRGSGTMRTFPEVDRVAWFDVSEARTRILAGQRPLLDRLEARLTSR